MRSTRGFTLIELLVVIAIIGILSSVVLASLNGARKKGRDARRLADMNQLRAALEMYADQNSNTYPDPTSGGPPSSLSSGGYIASVPSDPVNTSPYVYEYDNISDSGGTCTSNCRNFVLKAVLEDSTNKAVNPQPITGTKGNVNCSSSATAYCVLP